MTGARIAPLTDVRPLVILAASILTASAALGSAPLSASVATAAPESSCSGSGVSPRILAVGETVEGEIRGGERHPFRLQLPAGSFATGRVVQKGVDLVVEMPGANEEVVRRIDDFFETSGPLDFSVLIERERCVDFVLTPRLASAPAGSYSVKFDAARPTEPADAVRVRAEDATSEAVALRREGKSESLHKALERLLDSARLSAEAGDLQGKASALGSAAVIAYLLSQPRQATELSETSLSLHEAAGDKEGASASHVNLAALYMQLGEVERLLEQLDGLG
ncbi:MAG TPA: hypothetical protein VGV61_05240, partial [Thermoanaerobaculia bacterium]|nr:hypothetical protein [Thermoanaerobaculia bacterium]